MTSAIIKLKFLKRFGFIYYAFGRKMFHKPITSSLLFILEFCLISYGYVLLHNGLSTPDMYISYSKSMYFTVISATTVGYGDHYPIYTISQWYVILLMIMYLPFRFFYSAASFGFLFKNYTELKSLGRWFPLLFEHIIVYCNAESIERNNFLWLQRFIRENKNSRKFQDCDILLVNSNQDANEKLIHFFAERVGNYAHVHFVNANLNEDGFFEKIRIEKARRIYVLADEDDISSDSDVFDIIYRIDKETEYSNGVTAELVNDNNRERIRNLGADVILRPNRSMPELLISCTIAPGSAQMIEEISSRGGDSIERFEIPRAEFKWCELLYHLSMQGIGTATAVIYDDGKVDPNPQGNTTICNATGILILIYAMNSKIYEDVQAQINNVIEQFVLK